MKHHTYVHYTVDIRLIKVFCVYQLMRSKVKTDTSENIFENY